MIALIPERLMLLDRSLRKRFREMWPSSSTISGRPAYFFHDPYPRQQTFLDLTCEEAFYGGAVAGGKTDALLMAALQYVHVRGYSALILRRDFTRMNLASSAMSRAQLWLTNTDARWNGSAKRWTFPSGATLQFGYVDNVNDRYRYASSEFQFIGWDELTEFQLDDVEENPYLFLFSRLRKTSDMPVPLRVRSASNPGNVGHGWVKRRFIDASEPDENGVRWCEDRAFVPAKIADNPSMNEEEYRKTLLKLPPVTRDRLVEGDWDVIEGALIDAKYFQRYEVSGDSIWILDGGKRVRMVNQRNCRRFATIDTAGSSQQKTDEKKGKPASYSVIGIWDQQGRDLFLRHVTRGRWEWPQLRATAIAALKEWGGTAHVENMTVGQPLIQEMKSAGINAVPINCQLPGMIKMSESAKYDRAVAAGVFERLEAGTFYLPVAAPWLQAYEAELTTWRGETIEMNDQVDMTSYACYLAKKGSMVTGGLIK